MQNIVPFAGIFEIILREVAPSKTPISAITGDSSASSSSSRVSGKDNCVAAGRNPSSTAAQWNIWLPIIENSWLQGRIS
jgi:hypothetical protein